MKSVLAKTGTRAIAVALAGALACASFGCSASQEAEKSEPTAEEATEQAAEQASEDAGAAPLSADQIAEGTYSIEVESSSSMFRVVDAQLTVADGAMTCVMTLSGTGYGKLFMGTSDEAAQATEDQCIPFVENAEGAYTYEVPVEQLDADTDCAAWSIRKEKWYDRTLVFSSSLIPADSITA